MIPVLVVAMASVVVAPPAKKPAPAAPKAVQAAKPARLAPVWSVAFSPDGKRVAVGGYKRVTLYDAETGQRVAQWVASADAVRSLAFSPDGKWLAAGGGAPGQSGTAVVLDAATGKTVRAVGGHEDTVEAVAFSGSLLLTAADDESVHVSDIASGKTLATLTEHVGRCLAVAVPAKLSEANGGNIFATGGADKMVKIWDAGMRRVVVNFDQAQSPIWSLTTFGGLFIAACGDGSVRQFGVANAKEAPSPGEPQPRTGYQARVFGGAHEGGAFAVAASSPAAGLLVSGGADNAVKVWNVGGGLLRTLGDARGAVWGVAVAPDDKKIASASEDGVARVYEAATGKLIWEAPAPPPPPALPVPELGPVNTGTGLRAAYYAGTSLAGAPVLTRVEGNIDSPRTWHADGGAPDAKVGGQNFSARWEGYVEAPAAGAYTFSTRSDDGVRLWVNGVKIIDNWTDHGATDDTAAKSVMLAAGQRVAIKLEFYQGGGGSEIGLYWAYPGQDRQVIPVTRLYPSPIPGAAVPASPKPSAPPTKKPAPATPPGRMAKR